MDGKLYRFRERHRGVGKPNLKPGVDLTGKIKRYSLATGQLLSSENVLLTGTNPSGIHEKCWDQINTPTRNGKRGSRTFRTGGDFAYIKTELPGMVPQAQGAYNDLGYPFANGVKRVYEGYFICPNITDDGITTTDYITGGSSSRVDNSLLPVITSSMQNEAWNIRPKLERASLANALYELREVPAQIRDAARTFHDIWKSMGGNRSGHLMKPSRLSKEFLAIQFGWLPFINDIRQISDAVIFSKQYLADLSRQNNTWVKRSRVATDVETSSRIKRYYNPALVPSGEQVMNMCRIYTLDGSLIQGHCDIYSDVYTRVWYEGAFKFYRPELDMTSEGYDSLVSTVNRHLLLYGARINPTHIWRALPWSWLVDWFTNIGDLIQRADEQYNDGMVSKYLYIMHQKVRRIRSIHFYNFYGGALQLQFERGVTTKQRRSADSPYGFVLGWDLSPTQWSILTALGLSRNVRFARSF
jgi:hypothetical protein